MVPESFTIELNVALDCTDLTPAYDVDALLDEWCGTLGPGTTVIWQLFARHLTVRESLPITLREIAHYTGMAEHAVTKCITRLTKFGRAEWLTDDRLSVTMFTGAPGSRAPKHLQSQ